MSSYFKMFLKKNQESWDISGGPAVKTPCFHYRGQEFDP